MPPPADLASTERGSSRGDPYIAGAGHFEATTDAVAIDCGHDGLAAQPHCPGVVVAGIEPVAVLPVASVLAQIIDVTTSTECPVTCACEDHRAHCFVLIDLEYQLVHSSIHCHG